MPQRLVWIPAMIFLGGAACATAMPPASLPSPLGADALPPAARSALDQQFPNKSWQLASIAPAACVGHAATSADPAGTVLVTSDLDSDGLADIAAEVSTPHGVRLVVLLARDDGYHVFDVDGLGDHAASAGLALGKRGAKFVPVDTKFEDYYSSDTLTTTSCGHVDSAYLWRGLGFSKVTLESAAPATAGGQTPSAPQARLVAAPR